MYKKTELSNNVRVIFHDMPHMESASIGVWINTGSRSEDEKLCGISHFLEHMIFKGTPSRSTKKIKEEIEGRGGSLNGFTSEELTCYLAKVSGRHIDIALEVISDMALHACINEKDVERERAVIIEEIKMYRDLPSHQVHDALNGLMWPGHPLGRSVAGEIETVSSITRQDLVDYKKENYIPMKIVLVLCGNLKRVPSIKRIKNIFNINIKTKPADFVEFNSTQSRAASRILYKETEQSRISLGVHTFGRIHGDRYALSLLHIILGANMSSRLFENIREKKGLAYEIGTEIKRYKETGGFIINAGIEHSKIKQALGLIIKELKRIKDKPVSAKELKMAKEFFKIQLSLALEDTLDHMLWLGEYFVLTDKIPDKSAIVKKIDSIEIDDLQRVARSIFNTKKLNLAAVGPIKDATKKEIEKELIL